MSRVVYNASCWDCQEFYIGKTKQRLYDRKTEHFKSVTSNNHSCAIADHVTSTGYNMKWDHFGILARGGKDTHCKIKETLLIRDLQPTICYLLFRKQFIIAGMKSLEGSNFRIFLRCDF